MNTNNLPPSQVQNINTNNNNFDQNGSSSSASTDMKGKKPIATDRNECKTVIKATSLPIDDKLAQTFASMVSAFDSKKQGTNSNNSVQNLGNDMIDFLEALKSDVCIENKIKSMSNNPYFNTTSGEGRKIAARTHLAQKQISKGKNTITNVIEDLKEMFDLNRKKISDRIRATLIEEKKALSKEEQAKELDKLAEQLSAELGLDKTENSKEKTSKKNKSNQKAAIPKETTSPKKASSGESSSSQIQRPTPQPVQHAVNNTINLDLLKTFKLHDRILRWETNDHDKIKGFEDMRNGVRVVQYAQMDDLEIETQRMRHYLPGLESILTPQNKNKYYVNTDRGYRLVATLSKSERPEDVERGSVYININEQNIVFHKMFESWPGTETDYENFFQIPTDLSASTIDQEGKEAFLPAKTFSYQQLDDGIIEFTFGKKATHKLRVFPLI
jgi:hypothetical protein